MVTCHKNFRALAVTVSDIQQLDPLTPNAFSCY